MSNKNTKHLLFFSNFCQYSNDIYKRIDKYNLKDKFLMINISENKYKIPNIIKSVPTILLNDKRTIIKDGELDKFIENLNKNSNKDIAPFMNTSISEFSFLDENQNDAIGGLFGSTKENFRINTPPEDSSGNSQSITDRMNSMQENRNLEIQNFFKKK
jgi:hypothetical protein